MHEIERHRIIKAETTSRPVVTVGYLVELLGASEATIRRDIAYLHKEGLLRRVRGGAEALRPPTTTNLAGRPFSVTQAINAKIKRGIAKQAATLCTEGDSIIIGGGSTAFMMAEHIRDRRLQVMTNSFVIAEYLVKNSNCTVTLPAGKVYRDQNLILSPFDQDGSFGFYASKIFFGAQGIGPLGVVETDPQIAQGTTRLLRQAERRVLLIDSSKFSQRSSLIVSQLADLDVVITDAGADKSARALIQEHGCQLIITDDQATEN
ncbi:DeoR family transcriptional regulator [Litorivicinus lipolyticus]|uniref:DeoR family transcriptional regulator n=2 Tax=Litorivicinus lipolyticus TaxID=418701 RepID=A0A5Q2QH07_9GAMM|nr:DeoR family transcriptional regulator [Litorivicinus lipolyticus]